MYKLRGNAKRTCRYGMIDSSANDRTMFCTDSRSSLVNKSFGNEGKEDMGAGVGEELIVTKWQAEALKFF